MKSLLVDALRAANDDTTPTAAEPPSVAESKPEPELDAPCANDQLTAEELEIVEPGYAVDPVFESDPVTLEDDHPLSTDSMTGDGGAENDLRNRERVIGAAIALDKSVTDGAPAHATILDRAARATPLLCFALGCSSAIAFSIWNVVADPGRQSGPLANTLHGQMEARLAEVVTDEKQQSRFPLNTGRLTPRIVDVARAKADAPVRRTPVTIVRNRPRQASPAGQTQAGGDTFATLDAAYRAYLAGEVGQDYIQWLLRHRATTGGESAELEIRLLLQQYPDEARLHRALGSALAAAGRLPEARASTAQARDIEAGSRTGAIR